MRLIWVGDFVEVWEKPLVFQIEYQIKDIKGDRVIWTHRDMAVAMVLAAEIDVLVGRYATPACPHCLP